MCGRVLPRAGRLQARRAALRCALSWAVPASSAPRLLPQAACQRDGGTGPGPGAGAGGGEQRAAADAALARHSGDSRAWHNLGPSSGGAGGEASSSLDLGGEQPAAAAAAAELPPESPEELEADAQVAAQVQSSLAQAAVAAQEGAGPALAAAAAAAAAAAPAAAAVSTAELEQDLASGLARSSAASSAGSGGAGVAVGLEAAPQLSERAQLVAGMLAQLQQLPWRRVDVCFKGATFGFAHNNIQVTRRLLNFQGVAVPRYLAQQVADMEALMALVED